MSDDDIYKESSSEAKTTAEITRNDIRFDCDIDDIIEKANSKSQEIQFLGYYNLKLLAKREKSINIDILRILYINIPENIIEHFRFFEFLAFLSKTKRYVEDLFNDEVISWIIKEFESNPTGVTFNELLKIVRNILKYDKESAKIFFENNILINIIEQKVSNYFSSALNDENQTADDEDITNENDEMIFSTFLLSGILSFLSNIPSYLSPDEISVDLFGLLNHIVTNIFSNEQLSNDENLVISAIQSLSQIIYTTDGEGCETFGTEAILPSIIKFATSPRLRVSYYSLLCLRNFSTLDESFLPTLISFGLFTIPFNSIPTIDLYERQRMETEANNERILKEELSKQGIKDEETVKSILSSGSSQSKTKKKKTQLNPREQLLLIVHNISLCENRFTIESLLKSQWLPDIISYLDETGFLYLQEEVSFSFSAIINHFPELFLRINGMFPAIVELMINVIDGIRDKEEKTSVLNGILNIALICIKNSSGDVESHVLEHLMDQEFIDELKNIIDTSDENDTEENKQQQIAQEILSILLQETD